MTTSMETPSLQIDGSPCRVGAVTSNADGDTVVDVDLPQPTYENPWLAAEMVNSLKGQFEALSTFIVADTTTGLTTTYLIDPGTEHDVYSVYEGVLHFAFRAENQTVTQVEPPVSEIACFSAGTFISTPDGAVAVETLRAGDLVLTLSGEARPVKWVGSISVNASAHPAPSLVQPIRVLAHTFGIAQPETDLFLSPDHNIFVEGVLMPIKCLVNGSSISQHKVSSVTYHHIELETHDIILANNLPAETYLDTANRGLFGGPTSENYPDLSSTPDMHYFTWMALGYAPLVLAGEEVDRVRCRLRERSHQLARL